METPSGYEVRCPGHVRKLYARSASRWVTVGEFCDRCGMVGIDDRALKLRFGVAMGAKTGKRVVDSSSPAL
jgi:hypothetical protein